MAYTQKNSRRRLDREPSRELPISKTLAGVEDTRSITGGVRELHWHTSAEWAFIISLLIMAGDVQARTFVNDEDEAILWLFPGGIPHSIQVRFMSQVLLVFNTQVSPI